MKLKIQYASDLHLEFSQNWEFIKANPLLPVGDVLVCPLNLNNCDMIDSINSQMEANVKLFKP